MVPSQTELLFTLGLDSEVVGITKFCVHPEHWFRNKERVGGTKKLNLEKIRSINPDLILANKEENTKEDIDALSGEFNVWVSDIRTLEDALSMIRSVGEMVGKSEAATELTTEIRLRFDSIDLKQKKRKALYLIWKNPYMSAGGDTFISSMMESAGYENVLQHRKRYPELSIEEIRDLNPGIILLSSEPFPFKEKDELEIQNHIKNVIALRVDGEMFSWYGSRLLHSPKYFVELSRAVRDKIT